MSERKNKILKEAEKVLSEDFDKIKYRIDNIHDEKELNNYLDYLEKEIEAKKVKNVYYVDSMQGTYYSNVKEDEKIYDVSKEEDAKIVEKALEEATSEYIDVDPLTLNNYSDYENLTKVSILYDEQIGYRVVENPNGNFHGILKESTWFVYPSKDLNLEDKKNIEICNSLFTKDKNYTPYNENDIPVLDNVTPAQIFAPYQAVVDDPINKLTYSQVLIGEGVTVDENFKDGKIKDVRLPKIKNNIIEKGNFTITIKKLPTPDYFNPDLKENLIVGPTKYIDGTFIPYPRKQKENESFTQYEDYLQKHYEKYGYKVTYVDGKRNPYPHEKNLESDNNVKPPSEQAPESSNIKYEKFDVFLSTRYKNVNFSKLSPSVQIAYLNIYKKYLSEALKKYPDLNDIITSNINDIDESVESISTGRVF